MARTHKDQANFFRFKNRLDEASPELQEKAEIMIRKYKGYRFGNDRKNSARNKVIARVLERRRFNSNALDLSEE